MADWSKEEDELIIADYFQMLNAELKGLQYNKTSHRNRLVPVLNNRKSGAVEFKHRNISAILIKYGMPYIIGYKPLANYQALLEEEVVSALKKQKGIEKVFANFALKSTKPKSEKVDFKNWKQNAPALTSDWERKPRTFKPLKKNYLEIEQNNLSIGMVGEKLVFDYEIWRLHKAERPLLANQVKWVSKDEGDGAGYDILSKDITGKDMYIEVKTTKLGKESPIFFSSSEYDFSKINADKFFLYRVFDIKTTPKIFIKKGPFNEMCSFLETTAYKGYF